jgi:hypothetical protein
MVVRKAFRNDFETDKSIERGRACLFFFSHVLCKCSGEKEHSFYVNKALTCYAVREVFMFLLVLPLC